MKQKEKWAKEDVSKNLWTLGDGQSRYYPEKCWLAGFEFAKMLLWGNFPPSDPEEIENLGNEEIETGNRPV